MAAAAVDREFWCAYASFELTLKCPGMLWGPHCAPFVSLWDAFGVSLGHLCQSWGAPWATWGCIGAFWGCLETALGMPWDYSGPYWKKGVCRDHHRKPMVLKYRECTKTDPLEFACRSRGSQGSEETVHELPFKTYLPHAPGIRMT